MAPNQVVTFIEPRVGEERYEREENSEMSETAEKPKKSEKSEKPKRERRAGALRRKAAPREQPERADDDLEEAPVTADADADADDKEVGDEDDESLWNKADGEDGEVFDAADADDDDDDAAVFL